MDENIVDMLRNHNEQGLELLKKRYNDLIVYVLKSLRLSNQDIEECCQDIYMKIWNNISNYDKSYSSLKNYILIITRRLGLNYVRKNQKLLKEIQYEQMDIFKGINQEMTIDWENIIKKLTPFERDIFYRRFYYFQTIEEIALEKGKTYKSVESRIYRLKKKLRVLLKNEEEYYE